MKLQKVTLIVTVVDYDRIGTSEPIGRVVLGCNSLVIADRLADRRKVRGRWPV